MRTETILITLYQYKFEVMLILALTLVALLLQLNAMTATGSTYASSTVEADSTKSLQAREATYPEEQSATEATTTNTTRSGSGQSQAASSSAWPMSGAVTVEFGVPHRPWQSRHTGIDIISHDRTTPTAVKSFRAGTVIETTRSGRGFGNHVIINHGDGITSLYGHLSTIRVREGQNVSAGDKIGYEGSSGAATGRHLHFEVRQNNQPKNPRQFVDGNP